MKFKEQENEAHIMKRILYLLVLLPIVGTFFSFHFSEKKSYPQDYFRSPVNHPIRLSGTFGELRPNHFHSGIDIKTSNGSVGDPVLAAAKGHIVRIKIQEGGYGNALYMRHPNGFTSVYAHLHKFDSKIAAYVKSQQYKRKSFTIDLYPSAGQFSFEKGEEIGKIGNSGGSQGPHLHFEIRDSGTEKPINPLLFGINITDKRAPRMHQLKVYYLNDKRETLKTKTINLVRNGSKYSISGDTLNIGAWRVGFALKVYDHHDYVNNWNGIYSLKMLKDEASFYDFDMETFSFSETRYLNAHCDYKERVSKKSYFNRCYALPGNRLSIYNAKENHGTVTLHKGAATKIDLIASDVNGNDATLEFWVKRAEVKPPEFPKYNYELPHQEENIIKTDQLFLRFPKACLYEDLYLTYEAIPKESSSHYAPVHQIHNYKTPVHKYFDIGIRPSVEISPELKSKAFIAYIDSKSKITYNCGGKWDGGILKTKVRSLGAYSIKTDNIPPKIRPLSFSSNMKGYNKMTFKITDDMPTTGRANGLNYKATVDGKWILMEYDAKNDLLTHRFDENIESGKHQFRLEVKDDRGNKQVYEREFIR